MECYSTEGFFIGINQCWELVNWQALFDIALQTLILLDSLEHFRPNMF